MRSRRVKNAIAANAMRNDKIDVDKNDIIYYNSLMVMVNVIRKIVASKMAPVADAF